MVVQHMSRLPAFDVTALSSEQRRVYDIIMSGPRRSVDGPFRAWLLSPEFAERAQSLGLICRFGSSLAPRLSELAILVVAAHWRSEFEWAGHSRLALAAGLSDAAIDALRRRVEPKFTEADEAAVYRFSRELLENQTVSATVFESAAQHFGLTGIVELIGILGYYTLIAMTLAAFEIPAPAGAPPAFAEVRG
jgi:4-carboxymuconolactone decarboxylase